MLGTLSPMWEESWPACWMMRKQQSQVILDKGILDQTAWKQISSWPLEGNMRKPSQQPLKNPDLGEIISDCAFNFGVVCYPPADNWHKHQCLTTTLYFLSYDPGFTCFQDFSGKDSCSCNEPSFYHLISVPPCAVPSLLLCQPVKTGYLTILHLYSCVLFFFQESRVNEGAANPSVLFRVLLPCLPPLPISPPFRS